MQPGIAILLVLMLAVFAGASYYLLSGTDVFGGNTSTTTTTAITGEVGSVAVASSSTGSVTGVDSSLSVITTAPVQSNPAPVQPNPAPTGGVPATVYNVLSCEDGGNFVQAYAHTDGSIRCVGNAPNQCVWSKDAMDYTKLPKTVDPNLGINCGTGPFIGWCSRAFDVIKNNKPNPTNCQGAAVVAPSNSGGTNPAPVGGVAATVYNVRSCADGGNWTMAYKHTDGSIRCVGQTPNQCNWAASAVDYKSLPTTVNPNLGASCGGNTSTGWCMYAAHVINTGQQYLGDCGGAASGSIASNLTGGTGSPRLSIGEKLPQDGIIQVGDSKLTLQRDGNLVEIGPGNNVSWKSDTVDSGAVFMTYGGGYFKLINGTGNTIKQWDAPSGILTDWTGTYFTLDNYRPAIGKDGNIVVRF